MRKNQSKPQCPSEISDLSAVPNVENNKNEISLKNKLGFLKHRNKREWDRKNRRTFKHSFNQVYSLAYHLTETMHRDTFGI